ncbi:unnamed protein product [Prunus armeniaca]
MLGCVESISQVAEDTLPTPSLGTSSVATDTALRLSVAQPPAHPFLSTSDTTTGTSPQLPLVLPPTPHFLVTSDTATGTSPQLPLVLPPTPHFLVTSDIATGTSPQLPAVLPPTYPVPPRGEIIDDSHKDGDASISVGHLSEKSMSWQDRENSFMAFKAFFDGGAKILRSIDELFLLCYRFDGYAPFQGAFVYPETVAVLRKLMDQYGSFMEVTGITPSFLRNAAFRALGLVLHGVDTMEFLHITDHRLLCWWDAICEAITVGFHVDFLLNLVRNLSRAVFGARAIHSMKLSQGSDEVRVVADTLNIKGISADNAECVTEAATRSSPKASSVLFGHFS